MSNITEAIGESEMQMNYNCDTTNVETGLKKWCDTYRSKMLSYMTAVPHIPPTSFEMKLRHEDIKSGLIKQYNKAVENETHSNQLIVPLLNKMDFTFQELLELNSQEYRRCQVGFILGWKCNINKPRQRLATIDDRF